MSKRCAKACGRPPRQAGSAPAEFSFFLRHRHKMERASRSRGDPLRWLHAGGAPGGEAKGKGAPCCPLQGPGLSVCTTGSLHKAPSHRVKLLSSTIWILL